MASTESPKSPEGEYLLLKYIMPRKTLERRRIKRKPRSLVEESQSKQAEAKNVSSGIRPSTNTAGIDVSFDSQDVFSLRKLGLDGDDAAKDKTSKAADQRTVVPSIGSLSSPPSDANDGDSCVMEESAVDMKTFKIANISFNERLNQEAAKLDSQQTLIQQKENLRATEKTENK